MTYKSLPGSRMSELGGNAGRAQISGFRRRLNLWVYVNKYVLYN